MKTENFVMLTYDILEMRELSLADKIVLAYRLGYKTFYTAKPKTVAAKLHLGVKTVEASITKLRKLGLWGEDAPRNLGENPKNLGESPENLGSTPKILGDAPKNLGDNKSVSPMKTDVLLDSSLDIKLDKNKIEGLESAAAASALCDKPQTVFKKLDSNTTVTSESQEIKISGVTGSEAPIRIGIKTTGPSVPLGPDGRPITKTEMNAANFAADWADLPRPYTEADIAAGSDAIPSHEDIEAEFASLFERKAG